MQLSREPLLKALESALPAVAARTTKPILANVLIDDDAVHATDLEIGIRVAMPATGLRCVVPPGKLIAILRETADETIAVELKDDTLTVRTSSGRFKLPTASVDEFPKVECDGEGFVPVEGLAVAVKRVAFAADKRESGARWAVTGVLFEADGENLNVVATDTKRLAILTTPCALPKGSALIPQKALALAEKVEAREMRFDGQSAAFRADGTVIVTRLVEGRFPPHRDVMPKKFTTTVSLSTSILLSSVRQAMITAESDSQRIECTFGINDLKITSQSAESGESEIMVSGVQCDGEMTIAFDPKYLVDFLRVSDAEEITLRLLSPEKPAVFNVGEDYKYLIMPLA